MTANKIAAHNAGWRLQFRFADGALWSGMCELQRYVLLIPLSTSEA
jgi:hypothetical protein